MKHYYYCLLILCAFAGNAQVINFADAAFKTKLLQSSTTVDIARNASNAKIKIDANSNGEIEVSEAALVYKLNVNDSGISNLSGLEFFTNIRTLKADNNAVTSLPLTGLTHLQELWCGDCGLTSLDLTPFTELKRVEVEDNNLTSLNVTGLPLLVTIEASGNALDAIDLQGLTNLNTLLLDDNNLTWNTIAFGNSKASIYGLDLSDNNLGTADFTGFVTLYTLTVNNCGLNAINVMNLPALAHLEVNQNNLATLSVSGCTTLSSVSASDNVLTGVTFDPENELQSLDLSHNQIASIDLTVPKPPHLDLSYNPLTSFTVAPASLENLYVRHCLLTTLDIAAIMEMEDTMTIDASYNPMISVNTPVSYPSTLGTSDLNFSHCQLTEQFLIPVETMSLYLANNLLTSFSLDGFLIDGINLSGNATLQSVSLTNCEGHAVDINDCGVTQFTFTGSDFSDMHLDNNPMTEIDFSGLNCNWLVVQNCLSLVSVNIKNGYDDYLQLSNTPSLAYVCADENDEIEIPPSTTVINSYCSFTPGGTFYTIEGHNRFDANANGCDASDMALPMLKYSISGGSDAGYMVSDGSGHYEIPVQAGTHTFSPILENPSYYTVTPSSKTLTFPEAVSPFVQDFCMAANGVHPDLEVVVTGGNAVPGFPSEYTILIKNKGNQQQSGSVALAFDDALMDFQGSDVPTASQSTGNLSWSFANLLPFTTTRIHLTFTLNTPTATPPLNDGDILHFTASLTTAATDETPADNTFTLNQDVVNSFDPNDKTCLEGDTVAPSMAGKYVHYKIRFENTGSAVAQNIVVSDVIDTSKFDITSLVPMDGSHPFTTRVTSTNKVEFIFENIMLPFDDANNDGYVMFKIKTKPTLVVGNTFSNSASIFFDFNAPIVTNTATTTLAVMATGDFDFSDRFVLTPNPASDRIIIDRKGEERLTSVTIYDMMGRQVLVFPNANGQASFDVSRLTAGNYVVKVMTDKGSAVTKLVKR